MSTTALTIEETAPTDPAWQHARTIRHQVFVKEQNCPPEEEWDRYDATSRHYIGWAGGRAVATARWRTVDYNNCSAAKLERFSVLPEARGQGFGRQMVSYLIAEAKRAGYSTFLIHAQTHLKSFYASFGFQPVGTPFKEVDIPHIKMVLQPDEKPL